MWSSKYRLLEISGWESDEERIMVQDKNKKIGFLDENGEVVIPFEYDEATTFAETGYAIVKKKDEWIIINAEGKKRTTLSKEYEFVHAFSKEGLAIVHKFEEFGGECGLINDKGEEVTEFSYRYMGAFNKVGIAPFATDDEWGVMNRSDEIIKEELWPGYIIASWGECFLEINEDGYYAVFDEHGNLRQWYEEKWIETINDELARVVGEDSKLIDAEGNVYWDSTVTQVLESR